MHTNMHHPGTLGLAVPLRKNKNVLPVELFRNPSTSTLRMERGQMRAEKKKEFPAVSYIWFNILTLLNVFFVFL